MQRFNMLYFFKYDFYRLGIPIPFAYEDVTTLIITKISQSSIAYVLFMFGNYFDRHRGQANIIRIVFPVSNNVHVRLR